MAVQSVPENVRLEPCEFFCSVRQYRFPRSKKRRIRRKWSRRVENLRTVPWPWGYLLAGVVYAHPQVIERLRWQVMVDGNGQIPVYEATQSDLDAALKRLAVGAA